MIAKSGSRSGLVWTRCAQKVGTFWSNYEKAADGVGDVIWCSDQSASHSSVSLSSHQRARRRVCTITQTVWISTHGSAWNVFINLTQQRLNLNGNLFVLLFHWMFVLDNRRTFGSFLPESLSVMRKKHEVSAIWRPRTIRVYCFGLL